MLELGWVVFVEFMFVNCLELIFWFEVENKILFIFIIFLERSIRGGLSFI